MCTRHGGNPSTSRRVRDACKKSVDLAACEAHSVTILAQVYYMDLDSVSVFGDLLEHGNPRLNNNFATMTKPIKKQVRNIKKHYETAVFHFYIGLYLVCQVSGLFFGASDARISRKKFRNIQKILRNIQKHLRNIQKHSETKDF